MSLVLGCGAVRDEESVSSTRPCVAPESNDERPEHYLIEASICTLLPSPAVIIPDKAFPRE
ncbi:hypothetical protein RB213_004346 [Colletotrichum asianum]